MANVDSPVTCGDYLLYPLALPLPHTGNWQALVVVTHSNGHDANSRANGNGGATLPLSKSFPATPVLFGDEDSAKAYALRYGQMLVAGHFKDLPGVYEEGPPKTGEPQHP